MSDTDKKLIDIYGLAYYNEIISNVLNNIKKK